MARKKANRSEYGSLEAVTVEGSEDGATIVLLHGFGADMSDLASLAEAIEVPEGTNWIFPNGHLTVPLGGHYSGRGWFPISIAELERSMATGQAIDWSELVPPGLDDARTRLLELIDAIDVPREKLILGGFSQGGMLATEVTMHLEERPAGLAILSGTLINGPAWTKLAAKHAGFSFLQTHGARDAVLAFSMAQRLEKLLLAAGWKGQLQKFEGGHEIPQQVINSLGSYIRKRLG